jgi:hypothetical protein
MGLERVVLAVIAIVCVTLLVGYLLSQGLIGVWHDVRV